MLYNPFDKFSFDDKHCFLSGQNIDEADLNASRISVFPSWLMDRFSLRDQAIMMLDERVASYEQLQLPCSDEVKQRIQRLDREMEEAFVEGYVQVAKLDQTRLFQWIGRIVYGMIFNEIRAGVRQQHALGEPLNFSQVLIHKFAHFHTMLQSLIVDMQFDGRAPFDIHVFRVDNPKDFFSYRDEINTMSFSLRMGDFGIVACLQDNGVNAIYHEEIMQQVHEKLLHPIQFEELCGRFFYSAYLFNRLPDYTIMPAGGKVYVEPMSLMEGQTRTGQSRSLFDPWQASVYGQVLENFWKPWGYTLFEIIKDPERPMTFLSDEQGGFKEGWAVELPISGN